MLPRPESVMHATTEVILMMTLELWLDASRSVAGRQHHFGCLDHDIDLLALGDAQILHGVGGDHRGDDLAAADLDMDLAVDRTFLQVADAALDDVSCADLHSRILGLRKSCLIELAGEASVAKL